MVATQGIRDRRKAETRATLSAVATRAFLERGFDHVTITEIAALAGVSKMTVTNYFPLKEDLVFDRAEAIVALPVAAVDARRAGQGLAASLHDAYRAALDRGDPTMGHRGAAFFRMVRASPALRARAREIDEQRVATLAATLAQQPDFAGDRPGAAMAAQVLAGTLTVLTGEAQRRLLSGEAEAEIVAALRDLAARLFATADQAVAALRPAG